MPRRPDLRSVLLIGSGPIVIGQACEFDYSGTQGAKALREEGLRVILVNSNPATIMTDPELADRTYVEPLTVEVLERIIERERPDALLPTLGGQTALNLALALAERGVLARHGVELIGASVEAIEKAEDRERFKAAMQRIGLYVPRSGYARSVAEAERIQRELIGSFPVIVRPSFTLGGSGGSIVWTAAELAERVAWGLQLSPRGEILIEESVLGWKEYELEVMRDAKDNVVIICSIENFDPMGVHTGDSITVAPAMTLTDKEYQRMRDAAMAVIREIGVATGGSNIQFALDPKDGRMVVIEMNPRVSRSSALASKATGFPIAKIAAKLAIGYTLDEIPNDITNPDRKVSDRRPGQFLPAAFEPTIDYVVVKVPRFAFEKFPDTEPVLGPQMKSVGEVMAIGRSFREALQKALRSLETGHHGLDETAPLDRMSLDELRPQLAVPTAERLYQLGRALRLGMTVEEANRLTHIDPWFLEQLHLVIETEKAIAATGERGGPQGLPGGVLGRVPDEALLGWKRMGFSDRRIAQLRGAAETAVRTERLARGIRAVYKRVDTCAAEFEAHTPYLYSTYEPGGECEARPTARRKILILGGGPNRIGQGIEFDYCCVHAVQALREEGFETLMVNCNPETVSTDYDTADRLYFEPLTMENVLDIIDVERSSETGGASVGVIVQFGGQTPLRLAVGLAQAGVTLLGTPADAIDRAEDRQRFGALVEKLGLRVPRWGTAKSASEVPALAERIGYPVMVRPSYVLGGRAMQAVHDGRQLAGWLERMAAAQAELGEYTILVDQFLSDAIEIDVDAVSDGEDVLIGGVMEHIEEAGVHSGDAACVLPPFTLSPRLVELISEQTRALARELGVIGLMNVQFAVQAPFRDEDLYILEVNPRASRTVPFVSKATGVPLAKVAARVMAGRRLAELGLREVVPRYVSVKEAVFPFVKFPGVDTVLGPEMRSTGEVMGIARDFPSAFAKAQRGAGTRLPERGTVFLSVRDADKAGFVEVAARLVALGMELMATGGTARYLQANGLPCRVVKKVKEGAPHCVDAIARGEVAMVLNTTSADPGSIADSFLIRRTTLMRDLPYFTTLPAARAVVAAISVIAARGERDAGLDVLSLQEYHASV
ncbi:MAG TPA: carbamoyl-phosphate synthase large subunit [Polyangia bacterium]|jgi:carbamoyl-phosphate synthase large subunit|nr:carbamoyl-phosphate synthase large subunit [Polyangia bacterium]